MKNKEVKDAVKDIVLKPRKGGYIKGMGTNKYRLMDSNHNPIKNIDREIVDLMKAEDFLQVNGLVRVLSVKGQTFEFTKNY